MRRGIAGRGVVNGGGVSDERERAADVRPITRVIGAFRPSVRIVAPLPFPNSLVVRPVALRERVLREINRRGPRPD